MAVLGYFLKMATMADMSSVRAVFNGEDRLTVNVLRLVDVDLAYGKLTVGGLGCTIATGQVVDNECGNLTAGNVFDTIFDHGDLVTSVATYLLARSCVKKEQTNSHPEESSNIGNLASSRGQRSISHLSGCGHNLRRVELVGVNGTRCEGVARQRNGSSTCCSLASGDGAILSRRRKRKSAGDDRSKDGRKEALHVEVWK
jgi:hypothetical protein